MSKWILLLLLTVALSPAQVLYGTLTGTVTDATGAPIPSAKIAAVNTGTGITRETATEQRIKQRFRLDIKLPQSPEVGERLVRCSNYIYMP